MLYIRIFNHLAILEHLSGQPMNYYDNSRYFNHRDDVLGHICLRDLNMTPVLESMMGRVKLFCI